ncbi:hypothetical protein I3271_14200 [Photobacterium leiognathi]|uniref:hypothetical protein n=1 Tax=Photobacterium leiognathi TaxID=553611 RepID=UPI001EE04BE8|nr:hypothetical protein [Photobacterium leiognathi]MCG3885822.1 hypothetical protein [Photobacterium leiognathi]
MNKIKLPKINNTKLICAISRDNIRNADFLKKFKKPSYLYMYSILLHLSQDNSIKNINHNSFSITQLRNLYKIFKNETTSNIYDILDYLNKIDLFSYYNRTLSDLDYKLHDNFLNMTDLYYFNFHLLKGLKINSQRIFLYVSSFGDQLRFIQLSTISNILDINNKPHKLQQKSATTALKTLNDNFIINYISYTNKKYNISLNKSFQDRFKLKENEDLQFLNEFENFSF